MTTKEQESLEGKKKDSANNTPKKIGGDNPKVVALPRREPESKTLKAVSAFELMSQVIDEPPPIVEGIIREGNVGFIGGEPKSWKTWLALSLGLSVASGKTFLEKFLVAEARRVLIIEEEDSTRRIRDRLLRLWHENPRRDGEIYESYLERTGEERLPENLQFVVRQGARLDNEDSKQALRNLFEATKPELVILDALNRFHSFDENIAREIYQVLYFLDTLARKYQTAILVIHHFKKSSQNGPRRGGQRLRGSSALHGWSENSIYLDKRAKGFRMNTESKV